MANSYRSIREGNLLSYVVLLGVTLCFFLFLERSLIFEENEKNCPVLINRPAAQRSEEIQRTEEEGKGQREGRGGKLFEVKYLFRFQFWWSYHWEYHDENHEYSYRLTCPTQVRNVNLYYQNQLVAQSEADIFQLSHRERYHIYDCHGNHLFVISSGAFFGKILTPQDYLLEDNDGNVLSFIKTSHFIHSLASYEVTNPNGEIIGRVRRYFFRNNFEISLVKPDDPGGDMRALGLLFAQKAFLGFGSKQQDYCNAIRSNSFFGILLLGGMILGLIVRSVNNRHSSR